MKKNREQLSDSICIREGTRSTADEFTREELALPTKYQLDFLHLNPANRKLSPFFITCSSGFVMDLERTEIGEVISTLKAKPGIGFLEKCDQRIFSFSSKSFCFKT